MEKDVHLKYEAAKKQPPSEAISLRDGWRFSLDDHDVAENFFKPEFNDSKWKMITTSSAWEKQGFAGYDGWGFYRREITIPASWTEGRIVLVLGAVDESYRLFCDGKLIQEYRYTKADPDGWIKERRIDLTEQLTPGLHLIAVAVHDMGGDGGIWRPAALHLERPNLLIDDPLETLSDAQRDGQTITANDKKFSFRGLLRWAKPGTYCVTLRFTPQSNGSVTITVNTKTQGQWNKVAGTTIECNVGKLQVVTFPATIAQHSIGLNVIISVSMKSMEFQSLEITQEK